MDKVQKTSSFNCYLPLSEPFRIDWQINLSNGLQICPLLSHNATYFFISLDPSVPVPSRYESQVICECGTTQHKVNLVCFSINMFTLDVSGNS
jgi:hypothetical protein